jgi:hypothetical protein
MKQTLDRSINGPTISLAAAAAAALLLWNSAVCAASSVVVTALSLDDGSTLYTPESNPVAGSGCPGQSVEAAPEIIVKGATYEFLFWNINATVSTSAKVSFQPICGAANAASAWYWKICTESSQCSGPAPLTDNVLAFSLNYNEVISGSTPIESSIGGDWAPGSSTITPPASIEARPKIPGYGLFKGWQVLPGPLTTGTLLNLSGPPGGATVLGFYGFPDPDPCQPIRNEIAGGCSDLPSPAACAAYMKGLHAQLNACETAYGED